jgi:hypothetical protein
MACASIDPDPGEEPTAIAATDFGRLMVPLGTMVPLDLYAMEGFEVLPWHVYSSMSRNSESPFDPVGTGIRPIQDPVPTGVGLFFSNVAGDFDPEEASASTQMTIGADPSNLGTEFWVQLGLGGQPAERLSNPILVRIVASLQDYDGDGVDNDMDEFPLDPTEQ